MNRFPMARTVVRCLVAVGVALALLVSGGAPSDGGYHKVITVVAQ